MKAKLVDEIPVNEAVVQVTRPIGAGLPSEATRPTGTKRPTGGIVIMEEPKGHALCK